MDYSLAKDLKDAGFPQEGNGRYVVDPRLIVARREDRAYVPTLEELIEACGPAFELYEQQGKWRSRGGAHLETFEGAAPTEAVARLWLALNER